VRRAWRQDVAALQHPPALPAAAEPPPEQLADASAAERPVEARRRGPLPAASAAPVEAEPLRRPLLVER